MLTDSSMLWQGCGNSVSRQSSLAWGWTIVVFFCHNHSAWRIWHVSAFLLQPFSKVPAFLLSGHHAL